MDPGLDRSVNVLDGRLGESERERAEQEQQADPGGGQPCGAPCRARLERVRLARGSRRPNQITPPADSAIRIAPSGIMCGSKSAGYTGM